MRQNTLIGAIAAFIFMTNKNDRIWKKQKNINREERRFLASAIILSGMCANYAHPSPSPFRAEDAVWLADKLIQILSHHPIVLNNIKDNPQHTNQL